MADTRPIDCPSSDVELWSDEVLVDPYPTYRKLQDLGSVVWLDNHALVALPRFADVQSALIDWRTFSSAAGVGVDPATNESDPPSILNSDPPRHDEFLSPLTGRLSSRALASESARIDRCAEEHADSIVSLEVFDVVAELTRAYALSVICDMVGIHESDREDLPRWGEQAFNIFGPANERHGDAPAAIQNLLAHAAGLAEPGKLTPDGRGAELVGQGNPMDITYYTWSGVDTTVNALSSAIYLFARHPDQRDLVRDDSSLIPAAFSEVLRMHAPVHYFTRRTTAAVNIDGIEIPSDTRVLMMYGSANRDGRRYPNPDRFDVTRNPSDQLAFGRGVHMCVGATLARLEAHALIAALARRIERFDIRREPEWMLNNTLHGIRRLVVSATGRPQRAQ